MSEEIDRAFKKAARSALVAWKGEFNDDVELTNDLWVWYLERPSARRKLASVSGAEAHRIVRHAALQMLSQKMLASNEFNGRNLYSSESVRDALSGESTNRYLVDILPLAMESLSAQNAGQAEAVKSRYEDGVLPAQNSAAQSLLKKAVKSLTEHVNIIVITAGVDADGNVSEGPGSRHAVFPEGRKAQGDGHSDPTGDMAMSLIAVGDEPIPLCAMTKDRRPIRGDNGRFLDSDQTTTLRKEFVA
ncbi:hypothetical protein MycrhDRAFT_5769 [Mycolicibacterium rhodesiae JS60]|nr:hypothetical protein MycrhDRAFT_5769 [Mycolicibacterium rhodesiae JS60]